MPVYVKSHKRANTIVQAYTRSGLSRRSKMTGLPKLTLLKSRAYVRVKKNRTPHNVMRLHSLENAMRSKGLHPHMPFTGEIIPDQFHGRVALARKAGRRARKIQAYRLEILSRRG